jgi:putative sterol carrier protein
VDVVGVGSWLIAVDDGDVTVSEGGGDADYALSVDEDVLLRILRGEQNPMTAFLIGQLRIEGDLSLGPTLDKLVSPLRDPRAPHLSTVTATSTTS